MSRRCVLAAFAVLAGCADAVRPDGEVDASAVPDASTSADASALVDGGRPPQDADDSGVDGGDGPRPGAPAFVRVTLSPRRPLYTLADAPTARAAVLDAYGDPVAPAPELVWSVEPAGAAAVALVDGGAQLAFAAEGPGAVLACLPGGPCGRASFFVDDGPPALEVTAPEVAASLSGEPWIDVAGAVTGGGDLRVHVAGEPVEIGEGGSFAARVPAAFGLNRIEITADDGVRRPAARVVREVLWAPRWRPVAPERAAVPDAVRLRVSQRLLDHDAPQPEGELEAGLDFEDLASGLTALLLRAEPLFTLLDPTIALGPPLDLSVDAVRPGPVDLSLAFGGRGIELFARLGAVEADLRGALTIQGERVGLDGTLDVSAAAYASLSVGTSVEGGPEIGVEGADVAVERLTGAFADPTAQALLDTFGSVLREAAGAFASDLVDGLVHEGLTQALEAALASVLSSFSYVPIHVPADGLLPPLDFDLAFSLAAPVVEPRAGLSLVLDAAIETPPAVSPRPDPGVPDVGDGEPVWPPSADFAFAARLALVNTLLHALWREGGLRLDAGGILPGQLRVLVSEVRIDGWLPPVMVAAPVGHRNPLVLQVGEIHLTTRSPGREGNDELVVSVRADATVQVADGRFSFGLAETPDVKVVLVSYSGPTPALPADSVAAVLRDVVWPQLRASIALGLDLPVGPFEVGGGALWQIAPSIQSMSLTPSFPDPPVARGGWFVLPGRLTARLR